MMDKETYKRELVRMWDSLRNNYKGEYNCFGVKCPKCPLYKTVDNCDEALGFFEVIEAVVEAVERWSKEHPQKHKISKLEYDILETYSEDYFYYFYESELLKLLLKKGYFQGANEKMNIEHYFNNCEVEKDDG